MSMNENDRRLLIAIGRGCAKSNQDGIERIDKAIGDMEGKTFEDSERATAEADVPNPEPDRCHMYGNDGQRCTLQVHAPKCLDISSLFCGKHVKVVRVTPTPVSPKREPMTPLQEGTIAQEILDAKRQCAGAINPSEWIRLGIRRAEKEHGIGAGDE